MVDPHPQLLEDMLKQKRNLPFQGLTQEGWIKLALAGTLTFYIILISFSLTNNLLCRTLAFDYCAYWAGGKVANQHGIAQVYDLDLLKAFQSKNYPQEIIDLASDPSASIVAVPLPYLPIFILPFLFLSLFDLTASYFFWAIINWIVLFLYLRFLAIKTTGQSPSFRMLLMIGLSLPVFVNIREGQLNVWLAICAGEFIRALLSDKPLKAGLWLGGWLLKPQLLILIIPFLLIQRQIKALWGFLISTVTVLAVSFILIGQDGFLKLFNILVRSAGGGAVSNPKAMMNWRMVGMLIKTFTSPIIAWAVIIMGSLLTAAITLILLRKRMDRTSIKFLIAVLGIFAATCAVAWHAHFHTSMILIPPMFYFLINDCFSDKLFLTWVFLPIFVYFMGYIILPLVIFNIPITHLHNLINYAYGLSGFVINGLLLRYALAEYSRARA